MPVQVWPRAPFLFSFVQQLTYQQLLKHGRAILQQAALPTYSLDAELLLIFAAGCATREQLLLQLKQVVPEEVHKNYLALLNRRLNFEPVAQILGQKEFWSLPFIVNKHVLTPRPETEHIVEQVLLHHKDKQKAYRILDLGTGSGCLLLSLLSEYPNATGLGVDISTEALAVASQNATNLALLERAKFLQSDWFAQVPKEHFDIIVANPPYLSNKEWQDLSDYGVKRFEPSQALTDGDDGLAAYRIIQNNLLDYLAEQGVAIFEFGQGQHNSVRDIFATSANTRSKLVKDLAGIWRLIVITYTQSDSKVGKETSGER